MQGTVGWPCGTWEGRRSRRERRLTRNFTVLQAGQKHRNKKKKKVNVFQLRMLQVNKGYQFKTSKGSGNEGVG